MELQQALELADRLKAEGCISQSAQAVKLLAAQLRDLNFEYFRHTGHHFFDEPGNHVTG